MARSLVGDSTLAGNLMYLKSRAIYRRFALSALMSSQIPGTQLPMVDLRPIHTEHAEILHAWITDQRTKCWLDFGGGRRDISKRDLFLMVTSARNHARLFTLPGADRPLGLICLNDATNLTGSAEAWCVRGVYEDGPLNVTASAALLALASGFIDLDRQVIGAWVVDCNYLSIAMHVKLGLKQTGRMRNRHLVHGRRRDRLLFDMTRNEFAERYPDVPAESGRTMRQLQPCVARPT